MHAALSIIRHHHKVVGIDLAGSPKRNTGICTLKKDNITSCTIVHTDEEIINYVEKENPDFGCCRCAPQPAARTQVNRRQKWGTFSSLRPRITEAGHPFFSDYARSDEITYKARHSPKKSSYPTWLCSDRSLPRCCARYMAYRPEARRVVQVASWTSKTWSQRAK